MAVNTIYRSGNSVTRAVSKKSEDKHFLDNKKFKQDIKDYQELCKQCDLENKPHPQIPNSIGIGFQQIATSLSKQYNFNGYSWVDEFISDSLIKCCENIHKFNPDIGTSAFAYFQQCCYYEFLQRIKKENKQKKVKAAIVQNMGSYFDDVEIQEHDSEEGFHSSMSEILALQSVEIDYGKRTRDKTDYCEFDMFNVTEDGLHSVEEKEE